METLQTLHQELDIPNSAWREFYVEVVLAKLFAAQFLRNPVPCFGHRLDSREIETGGVNEWLNEIEQRLPKRLVTCCDARLEQHLQFPVPGPGRVVLLSSVE